MRYLRLDLYGAGRGHVHLGHGGHVARGVALGQIGEFIYSHLLSSHFCVGYHVHRGQVCRSIDGRNDAGVRVPLRGTPRHGPYVCGENDEISRLHGDVVLGGHYNVTLSAPAFLQRLFTIWNELCFTSTCFPVLSRVINTHEGLAASTVPWNDCP